MVLRWSYIGEGGFSYSLNLFPNILEDSSIYTSLHSTLSHLILYVMLLFLVVGSLSLGTTRRSFDGLCPFEVHLYAMFLVDSFYAFTKALCIQYPHIASFIDGVGTAVY